MKEEKSNSSLVWRIVLIRRLKFWRERGRLPKKLEAVTARWMSSENGRIACQQVIDQASEGAVKLLKSYGPFGSDVDVLNIALERMLRAEHRKPGRPKIQRSIVGMVTNQSKRKKIGRPLNVSLSDECAWIMRLRGAATALWAIDEQLPNLSIDRIAEKLVGSSDDDADTKKTLSNYLNDALRRNLNNPDAKTKEALIKRAQNANKDYYLPDILKKSGG